MEVISSQRKGRRFARISHKQDFQKNSVYGISQVSRDTVHFISKFNKIRNKLWETRSFATRRIKMSKIHGAFAKENGILLVVISLTTVIRIGFRLRAVIWLELPWSHVRRVMSSLNLLSIVGFLRVLRFPPVVTLDPWGITLTGPLGRTAQVADRVI